MSENNSEKRKIKIILSYDGTDYIGWQKQARDRGKSIQEEVEKALSKLLRHKTSITGAGRTDSGVHAIGQTAHFLTSNPLPAGNLKKALNHILPEDIRILDVSEAKSDFHARYSAKSKTYRYTLSQTSDNELELFSCRYFWQIGKELDLGKMKEAASLFLGQHDFKNFAASGCVKKSYVRTVNGIEIMNISDRDDNFPWQRVPKAVYIDISADGFLYKMARLIVAVLIEAGSGRMNIKEVEDYINNRKRLSIMPALAKGLMLIKVEY